MAIKTNQQIKTDLEDSFRLLRPSLDIESEGSVERDIFIDAPVDGSISDIWQEIDNTQKAQSIDNYETLTNEEMDALVANEGLTRISAKFAVGTVFFYANNEPTSDIVIPIGTKVQTAGDNPIVFETTQEVILPFDQRAAFYNVTLNKWGIEVPIKCTVADTVGNKQSNTITILVSNIVQINSVNNINNTTNGAPEETNSSLRLRYLDRFEGRNLSTPKGLQNKVKEQDNVLDALYVGPDDDLMIRDDGHGGAIDIYVLGELVGVNVQSKFVEENDVLLTQRPALSVTSVTSSTGVEIYEEVIDYNYVQDTTGGFAYSEKSQDKIVLTSTGFSKTQGNHIVINYNHNALIQDVQDVFDDNLNKVIDSDILVKQATKVLIDLAFTLFLESGFVFNDVVDIVNQVLTDSLNEYSLDRNVEQADLIALIKSVNGVDNIDLTTFEITPIGGGEINPFGDVEISRAEYARPNNFVITQG